MSLPPLRPDGDPDYSQPPGSTEYSIAPAPLKTGAGQGKVKDHWSSFLIVIGTIAYVFSGLSALGSLTGGEPLAGAATLGTFVVCATLMVTGYIFNLRYYEIPTKYALWSLLFPIGIVLISKHTTPKRLEMQKRMEATVYPRYTDESEAARVPPTNPP